MGGVGIFIILEMRGWHFLNIIILEVFSLGFKTGKPLGDPLFQVVAERVLLPLLARDSLATAYLNKSSSFRIFTLAKTLIMTDTNLRLHSVVIDPFDYLKIQVK